MGSEFLTPCQNKGPWLVHGPLFWYNVGGETPVQVASNIEDLYSVATAGRGGQLDQLARSKAESEVRVRIPYTVPTEKPKAVALGFSVGIVLGGETPRSSCKHHRKFMLCSDRRSRKAT